MDLGEARDYRGAISGFGSAGGQTLDLEDIGFAGSGEASFSGDANGGMLTVSDGQHIARLNLSGDYLNDAFIAASDGHGGVIITLQATQAARPGAFVAAMAAMAAPPQADSASGADERARHMASSLVTPQSAESDRLAPRPKKSDGALLP